MSASPNNPGESKPVFPRDSEIAQLMRSFAELGQRVRELEEANEALHRREQGLSAELDAARRVQLAIDLAERKQTEEALRESEARANALIKYAPTGIYEIDYSVPRITSVNGAMCQLSGYTREELLAMNPADILDDDGRKLFAERIGRRLAGEKIDETVDFRVRKKDGSFIYVTLNVALSQEDPHTALVIGHDVTERKRVEAERERLLGAEREARALAERAVKARDEFISIAAHELKTPVTSLKGFAQLLSRHVNRTGGLPDPQTVLKATKRIDEQSNRLNTLTDQLLDLSRLENGKLVLNRGEMDLGAMVQDLVGGIRYSHPERTIEVRPGQAVHLYADALRLEQVVTNLIDNALKFSLSETAVEVGIAPEGKDLIRLTVRDHGIGIPEDKRKHLFEQFYQAHAEGHYGGMGIGLFLSRQIVELHGGTITAEHPEDGGCCFVIRLPASS